MMKWRILTAAFGMAAFAAPAQSADKPGLQGTWQLTQIQWAEEDKTSSIYVSSKGFVIIDADTIIHRGDDDDGKLKDRKFGFTVDDKKKPAVYVQKSLDGDKKGAATTGIYEVDCDTLRMCSKEKGLPDDFTIKQGKDIKDKYLYVYKRVKK